MQESFPQITSSSASFTRLRSPAVEEEAEGGFLTFPSRVLGRTFQWVLCYPFASLTWYVERKFVGM